MVFFLSILRPLVSEHFLTFLSHLKHISQIYSFHFQKRFSIFLKKLCTVAFSKHYSNRQRLFLWRTIFSIGLMYILHLDTDEPLN